VKTKNKSSKFEDKNIPGYIIYIETYNPCILEYMYYSDYYSCPNIVTAMIRQ